jgi:hypothetical protein
MWKRKKEEAKLKTKNRKKNFLKPGMVAEACNSTYSGGGNC